MYYKYFRYIRGSRPHKHLLLPTRYTVDIDLHRHCKYHLRGRNYA